MRPVNPGKSDLSPLEPIGPATTTPVEQRQQADATVLPPAPEPSDDCAGRSAASATTGTPKLEPTPQAPFPDAPMSLMTDRLRVRSRRSLQARRELRPTGPVAQLTAEEIGHRRAALTQVPPAAEIAAHFGDVLPYVQRNDMRGLATHLFDRTMGRWWGTDEKSVDRTMEALFLLGDDAKATVNAELGKMMPRRVQRALGDDASGEQFIRYLLEAEMLGGNVVELDRALDYLETGRWDGGGSDWQLRLAGAEKFWDELGTLYVERPAYMLGLTGAVIAGGVLAPELMFIAGVWIMVDTARHALGSEQKAKEAPADAQRAQHLMEAGNHWMGFGATLPTLAGVPSFMRVPGNVQRATGMAKVTAVLGSHLRAGNLSELSSHLLMATTEIPDVYAGLRNAGLVSAANVAAVRALKGEPNQEPKKPESP